MSEHPDYAAWKRFEEAIREKAKELCQATCEPRCRQDCSKEPGWKWDAIRALNAESEGADLDP